MKKTLLYIATFGLLLLTFVLGAFFDKMQEQTKIKQTHLDIYPMQKTFVQAADLQQYLRLDDSLYNEIDIAGLEQNLEQNEYVDQAEVYLDLNGKLVAEVRQYHPVARVMGTPSYYLDQNGDKKPLSPYYTEKVILIFGDVNTDNKTLLMDLICRINNDEILQAIVTEIHIHNNTYEVSVKDLPARLKLAAQKDWEAQLYKLKAIYAYLIKNNKQNLYKQIDLRFQNQVVCKK